MVTQCCECQISCGPRLFSSNQGGQQSLKIMRQNCKENFGHLIQAVNSLTAAAQSQLGPVTVPEATKEVNESCRSKI